MDTTHAAIKLPAGHARDWMDRLGEEAGATVAVETTRTITLNLPDDALRDLISDALYYVEEMDPANTGDVDYRPKARTLLQALDRAGVKWERRRGTFLVTLTERP
jgi:hypothetical protein